MQAGNRQLFYNKGTDRDDMRVLYLLATITSLTIAAPWAFAVAPALAIKLTAWWGGGYVAVRPPSNFLVFVLHFKRAL